MMAFTQRREFITLLGTAAAAWPLAAGAQDYRNPVIGYVSPSSFAPTRERVAGFQTGLASIGYVEGRNVRIEHRWAENHNDRFPALVDDLLRRRVDVLACLGS